MFPTHLLELEEQEEVSETPLFLVLLSSLGQYEVPPPALNQGKEQSSLSREGMNDSRAPRFPSPLSLSWINA